MAHRFGETGARPKAYLQGSLHADELPGMLVASHLVERLREADARGEILGEIAVVPMANPIGLANDVNGYLAGRYALGGGGNFNRNWPDLLADREETLLATLGADPGANVAAVRTALREAVATLIPEGELAHLRKALLRLAVDSDICLDLHCDEEAPVHLYLGTPLWPDATDLAAELGCRAVLLADDSGGGPFDEAVGGPWWRLAERAGPERPVPPACLSATVELRGKGDLDDALAARDAAALARFLTRRGLIAGDPGPAPELGCAATPLTGTDVLRSPAAGLICYKAALGARVKAGDVVAEILDPTATDAPRVPVRTQTDGLLLSRIMVKLARPGMVIAKVVGAEPLPDRATGMLMEDR